MTPLEKMIFESMQFMNWAVGMGFCPNNDENVRDPADILFDYSKATGFEDWDTIDEHVLAQLRESPGPRDN